MLLIGLIFAVSFSMEAIIANPEPFKATLSDGTVLEIILNGDEYFNFHTTSDGIPIVKRADNQWVYAVINSRGELSPSAVAAKSPEFRSSEEAVVAESFRVDSSQLQSYYGAAKEQSVRKIGASNILSLNKQNKALSASSNKGAFRGLVVLIEYNDKSFTRPDIATIFNEMINKDGYKGFTDLNGKHIDYTGSVRDYFVENSDGQFSPKFDVVGPVQVPFSCKAPQQTAKVRPIISAALDAIDKDVNFADYDMDGDGTVDMIYFIFSGAGSNVSGNSSLYLWPHASILTEMEYDGVKPGRYACSTELYGLESKGLIDGIGVICHEFSHVLGLPDLYDVDYATGGQSIHPGVWSIMAGGAYLNSCRTPSAYCAYERYASGFITPQTVTESGKHILTPLQDGGKALKIPSSVPDEFFLLECRRKKKWDEYLPGEGLIVWRVDSTDASAWFTNRVNAIPEHNYLELIRAKSQCVGTTTKDTEYDPFPGASSVTELTNNSTPSIRSWTGIESPFILSYISYNGEGAEVTVTSENLSTVLEDFESMPLSDSGTDHEVIGKFGKWRLTDSRIVAPENTSYIIGTKALEFVKGSEAVVSEIKNPIRALSINLGNSSISTSIIRCFYTVGEEDWTILRTNDGSENISVGAKSARSVTFPCDIPSGAKIKIAMTTGNSSTPTYVDNVRLVVNQKDPSGVEEVKEFSGFRIRKLSDLTVEIISEDTAHGIYIYDMLGNIISILDPKDGNVVTLPQSGVYIIRQASNSMKIIF